MSAAFRVLLGLLLILPFSPASALDPIELVLAHGLEEIESPGGDPWKAQEWERKHALDILPVTARIENGKLVLAQRTGPVPGPFPPAFETPSTRYVSSRADREYATRLDAVFKDGRPSQLLAVNVMAIVPRGAELLLFSGDRHMVNTGAVRRVVDLDAAPRVELVTLLPEAPEVVLEKHGRSADRSHLYIVSRSSLMSIFMGSRGHSMLKTHYWGHAFAGRAPFSAVFYRDHLVIGSSTGVAVARMQQDTVVSVRYFATKGRSVQLRPAQAK